MAHTLTHTPAHKVKRPRNNDDVAVAASVAARVPQVKYPSLCTHKHGAEARAPKRARAPKKESRGDEVKHTGKIKQMSEQHIFFLSLPPLPVCVCEYAAMFLASHLIITFLFVNFAGLHKK